MVEREAPPVYAEGEVSLLEMWEILVRRKLSVIGILIICLVVASVYLLVAAPVYQARTTLRIGQVADAGILEEPEVLLARVIEEYGEDIATGSQRPMPFLKTAALQKNSKQVVDLAVYGSAPDQAADFLRHIADGVIARHREIFNTGVDLARHRIEQIENQRRLLNEISSVSADLPKDLRRRDPVQASLLNQEHARIAQELVEISRELPLWQEKLNPPKTVMTELLGEVVAPIRPASPKKVLILSLAVALGVTGGVLWAFVAEYIARIRMAVQVKQRNKSV